MAKITLRLNKLDGNTGYLTISNGLGESVSSKINDLIEFNKMLEGVNTIEIVR